MKTLKLFCLCIPLLLSDLGCNLKDGKATKLDWQKLIKKYSQSKADSLKLKCVNYYKNNVAEIKSQVVVFYSKSGKRLFENFATPTGLDLRDQLQKGNIFFKIELVPDSQLLSNDFIEMNIEQSIKIWQATRDDYNVSEDDFFDYILPYKIVDEYPENWRQYFHKLNGHKQPKHVSPQYVFDSLNRRGTDLWFHYDPKPTRFAQAPSLSQLLYTDTGDCSQLAYLYTYVMRAAGIPSAVDFIPKWGSKNGSHMSEVFLDKNMNLSRETVIKPSKVIRKSFRRIGLWKDSIEPLVRKDSFLLKELTNNHWKDVTHLYTKTSDVALRLPSKTDSKFAYLCVFNYGRWQPVFWGAVKKDSVRFKNMGTGILYRIAIPDKEGYEVVGGVFLLDSRGTCRFLNSKTQSRSRINLRCRETRSEGPVRKGALYQLWVMEPSSALVPIAKGSCLNGLDVEFSNIPKNCIYRMTEIGKKASESRLFSYKNGTQHWY